VDLGVLVLLVQRFGLNPAAAAALGYVPGVVIQYFLCRCWVFPGTGDSGNSFAAFLLFSLVGLGITWAVVETLSGYCGIPYLASKFVALAASFVWNFLSRKWILFRTASRMDLQLRPVPVTIRA
jgi:putative flippase GtrA